MEPNEQESAFVKAFIVKDKQERYLQLLGSPEASSGHLGPL